MESERRCNLQHYDIGRSTTKTRENNEDGQAEKIHGLAPEDISKFRIYNHEARVRDEVGGDNPITQVKAAESVCDGHERGAHDGGLECRQEESYPDAKGQDVHPPSGNEGTLPWFVLGDATFNIRFI